MSASIDSIPIQLELTTRSIPPVPPTDLLTGLSPKFWRGSTVAIQLGIFDKNGVSVDLSNVVVLNVGLYPIPTPPEWEITDQTYSPYSNLPFPSFPPAPLLVVSILAASITPFISREAWIEGNACNAVAVFDWTLTQSLNLQGNPEMPFMLAVTAVTASGKQIVYGAGYCTVFESGAQGIYLPNGIVPLDIPAPTIFYIEPNQQLTYATPISIEGTLACDGQLIQVA